MRPLPNNGPPQRLVARHGFPVARLSPDPTRVHEPVLLRVELPVEMLRQTAFRNGHNLAAPSDSPDLFHPFGPHQRLRLAYVVSLRDQELFIVAPGFT